jgi:poly-gamma-glutamate synthesis protein (capsule biosynthesis protein)
MADRRPMVDGERADTIVVLTGDLMTGRGIDQILPWASAPELHEAYVRDARVYVGLAEAVNGPIPRCVDPGYIWGDALEVLAHIAPHVHISNLETSVTRSDAWWPGKGVHYRMHPANVPCLKAARIDVCALANNHVLDYGHGGLEETLQTLAAAGFKTAGAGRDTTEAQCPAIVELPGRGRVIVFSFASETSGVPRAWAAAETRAGVDVLNDLSPATADDVSERVQRIKRQGDVVVASIHWGGNWGYELPRRQVDFAHRLIDGGIDIVHGHSSHHPRPIEVYRNRLVLYGCGDFIDDYEGIGGYEAFRSELALLYAVALESGTGRLVGLDLTPMRIRRMRLTRASSADGEWLGDTLSRISRPLRARVEPTPEGTLVLRWSEDHVAVQS